MSEREDAVTDGGDTGGRVQRDWRNPVLVGLAIVVAVLLGTVIGFMVSGDDEGSVAAGSSTTTVPIASETPSTTVGTTDTTPPTVATTQGTAPSTGLTPDTSVEGQITFFAVGDTFTDATDIDEINGFEPVVELENDSPELKLGLIRFDVTEAGTVDGATLKLTIVAAPSQPVTVHRVEGDWEEMETTSGNAPSIGETVATIPAGGSAGDVVEVDVSEVVTGDGLVDFYLATSGESTISFGSKESGTPPALTVLLGG